MKVQDTDYLDTVPTRNYTKIVTGGAQTLASSNEEFKSPAVDDFNFCNVPITDRDIKRVDTNNNSAVKRLNVAPINLNRISRISDYKADQSPGGLRAIRRNSGLGIMTGQNIISANSSTMANYQTPVIISK